MALLFGRRPPKRAPALKLRDYLVAAPAVPMSIDYLAVMDGGWQMLGNDTHGDCVAVTWANTRRLVSTTLGVPSYPTLAQTMEFYGTQNPPGQDNGMDIQTAIEGLVKTAGPDGVKALGFAAVDYTNPAEVKAAISIFGSVWTGINVLDTNQTEFSENQPFNYDPNGNVVGGHSIITGGYGTPGAGALGGDERFITWAQETSFTDSFWSNEVEECWAVIWPEHLGLNEFMANMDLATFAGDYTEITGQPFPVALPNKE
jgi:hypothetical protein